MTTEAFTFNPNEADKADLADIRQGIISNPDGEVRASLGETPEGHRHIIARFAGHGAVVDTTAIQFITTLPLGHEIVESDVTIHPNYDMADEEVGDGSEADEGTVPTWQLRGSDRDSLFGKLITLMNERSAASGNAERLLARQLRQVLSATAAASIERSIPLEHMDPQTVTTLDTLRSVNPETRLNIATIIRLPDERDESTGGTRHYDTEVDIKSGADQVEVFIQQRGPSTPDDIFSCKSWKLFIDKYRQPGSPGLSGIRDSMRSGSRPLDATDTAEAMTVMRQVFAQAQDAIERYTLEGFNVEPQKPLTAMDATMVDAYIKLIHAGLDPERIFAERAAEAPPTRAELTAA